MSKPTYRVKAYHSSARPKLKACVVWKDDADKWRKKFFRGQAEAEVFAALQNELSSDLALAAWKSMAARRASQRSIGVTAENGTDYFEVLRELVVAVAKFEENPSLETLADAQRCARVLQNHLNSQIAQMKTFTV